MDNHKNTMGRREFLTSVEKAAAGVGASSYLLASNVTAVGANRDSAVEPSRYHFKMGMYLPELGLPFDESLAKAKEIGAEYIWFNQMPNEPDIAQMSDAEADRMAKRVSRHDLKIFLLNAGNPFKTIHLTDLNVKTMRAHPAFRKELGDLTRSMQIASRIGVKAVGAFTFAWPGEYSAGKPTWPMRWLTRGGVIADVDMQKLVMAFSLVGEQAER